MVFFLQFNRLKKEYKKENFDNATQNWMNFQPQFGTDETFKSTCQQDFTQLGERGEKFKIRETYLTKDE